jgi:hypothetical protein
LNLVGFTLLVSAGSLGAGCLGSLTGLGGGVVLVPLLALGFGVDMRYAIGASLILNTRLQDNAGARCTPSTSRLPITASRRSRWMRIAPECRAFTR